MRVNAIKSDNSITIYTDKGHHVKQGEPALIDEIYDMVVKINEDPSEEGLQELLDMVKPSRVVTNAGDGDIFEERDGRYYLIGHMIPMPDFLVQRIIDDNNKDYPVDHLVNFWKLCMLNPDPVAREDLFKFAVTYGFPITSRGYCMAYKSVAVKGSNRYDHHGHNIDPFNEFISEMVMKMKQQRKGLGRCYVFQYDDESGDHFIKVRKNDEPDEMYNGSIGTLAHFNEKIMSKNEGIDHEDLKDASYTDKHTYTMNIELGVPVSQKRSLCDSDPKRDCSKGLHVGSRKYVSTFGDSHDRILAVLFSPTDVIAVPEYDNSKMRVCKYFPYALVKKGVSDFEEVESTFFEDDYADIEREELEAKLDMLDSMPRTEENEEMQIIIKERLKNVEIFAG